MSSSHATRRSTSDAYGDSGLNKDDARAKWGEEQVHVWRRSHADAAAAGRESLKLPAARPPPHYEAEIRRG